MGVVQGPLNWSAGNEVTGTLYLGCTGSLGRDSLELRVTNGRNEAKVFLREKYTERTMNQIWEMYIR